MPYNVVDKVVFVVNSYNTFGTLVIVFLLGFGVGMIVLAVYAHKARERESQLANDAVRRENLALERGKQDVINRHNADIEMRRKIQMQMIKTLNVLKSLETPSVPDISKGVVYASSDLLSGGLYHHAPNCSRGTHMVLISKVVADQLSLTPCPSCSKYPMPESDPTVYITENNLFASLSKTVVYHKANCYCIQGRRVPIKLSSANARNYAPCSHCCPPMTWMKPTIWF